MNGFVFYLLFLYTVPASLLQELNKYVKQYQCNNRYSIVVDMSIPSHKERFFVMDLQTNNIVYESYVAHGKGSGRGQMAVKFSDKPGSLCTALGPYKIRNSYIGKHGKSYVLKGLSPSNKNAESRSIVIHSAFYVEKDFIEKNNRCGNSWGCPALSSQAFNECEKYFVDNTLLYIYKK